MINYSLTIDGVSYDCEVGATVLLDGTEEFDSGTIEIKNIALATEFTEADKVVLVAGTKTFELIVQADKVDRITSTLYDHTVTLTEETAKLTKAYSVDRFFTTFGGALLSHYTMLNNVRLTTPFFNPLFTINTSTVTALGTDAPQKKFEGMNVFQIATDIMRGIKSVPRLVNGVLEHTPYNEINNPITLSDLTGWQRNNEFNNYATTIVSRAKNITYDLDITTGSTWFPSQTESVTPRSSTGDYSDDKSQYQFPLDIRRINQIYIINYELSGGTKIDMDISNYVFSKEAWDGLQLGSRTQSTLQTQIAQRNTLYFTVGGNILENMATEFDDSLGAPQITVKELVKSWLVNNGFLITDFKDFSIKDLEIRANFQPYVEGNISSEKWDISTTKVSEILNNQKDTTLDIGRYGVVMNTIANRLDNSDWVITIAHNDETELLELFDYTSDMYKIIKAKYQFYPSQIIGTYQLSLRWTTLNGYQSVYKNTDPYSIGRDNVNANFRYTEYLEFSTTNKTDTGNLTTQGKETLMNIFDYASGDDLPVNVGILDSSETTDDIAMGVMSTGAQGIRFIGRFQEPKNAGYELVSDAIGQASSAVPYADESGFVQRVQVDYANKYTVTGTAADQYPRLDTPIYDNLFATPELPVLKNPNEVLGLTTELLPSTDEEGIYVYNPFSRLNNLVNDGSVTGIKVYYSLATTKYDEFDVKPKEVQHSYAITVATISKTLMSFDISSIGQSANVTWAIGTADELFFAVNYDGTVRNKIYINNLLKRSTTESL